MKTILFLFFSFFLITSSASAQSWQILNSGVQGNILDVFFSDQLIGYATISDGTYLKTGDGGITWNQHSTGFGTQINSIDFINSSVGFGVGTFGRIFKTINGGDTWAVSSPVGFNLKNIKFADSETAFIVGDHSTVLKTVNGGNTWIPQVVPSSDASLTDVTKTNDGKWYITVTSPETNLMYSVDGINWVDGKIRGGYIMSCAIDFNNTTGYIGGFEQEQQVGHYSPLLFLTSNNGSTWREYKSLSHGQIYGIVVSPNDANKACAVGQYINDPTYGNNGLIMRTTDGGFTWSEEQWNTPLRSVTATTTSFYVVGNNGLILKSDHTVGINQTFSNIPEQYTLSQNYPNPFNPETKINFSIPKKTNVSLIIYDITGKEIETLVNEVLSAGSYQYSFTAKNLPTGSYFYRLKTDNFSRTKNMMLIK